MGMVASAAITVGFAAAVRRLGRRSGATDGELGQSLPGDELVLDAVLVCDRAATYDVPAEQLWPWLVQLGKGRAGWYFPAPLRSVTDRISGMRGADQVSPQWQDLAPGDFVPDYGPGEPLFRAEVVDPPHVLAYLTLRDSGDRHRWPTVDNPIPRDVFALSFGSYLIDLPGGRSRLHLRVRCRPARPWRFPAATAALAGCLDWLTVTPLFAGLRQRVTNCSGQSS